MTRNLSIGLRVGDIDAAVAALVERGVSCARQENPANRFAFFQDPDGTPLYLFQPTG